MKGRERLRKRSVKCKVVSISLLEGWIRAETSNRNRREGDRPTLTRQTRPRLPRVHINQLENKTSSKWHCKANALVVGRIYALSEGFVSSEEACRKISAQPDGICFAHSKVKNHTSLTLGSAETYHRRRPKLYIQRHKEAQYHFDGEDPLLPR